MDALHRSPGDRCRRAHHAAGDHHRQGPPGPGRGRLRPVPGRGGPVSRQPLNIDGYHVPVKGFTQAVQVSGVGQMVYVSGLTARQADGSVAAVGDAAGQAREIMRSLQRMLAAAGATLDDVVRIVTYLTDIADHPAVHAVRREFFGDEPPASTSVQVVLLYDERQLVEIEATAVLP
ncbi:MAG: RidA family protein [Streptosporangiales bacterium]|nr:RidA family protein [Streptosporangiales bacterium]